MELRIRSKCLWIYVTERSFILFSPEKTLLRFTTKFLRPSHPPGSRTPRLVFPGDLHVLAPCWDTIRSPNIDSVRGGHTRRGPPAGAGGVIQHVYGMIHGIETWRTRNNAAGSKSVLTTTMIRGSRLRRALRWGWHSFDQNNFWLMSASQLTNHPLLVLY